jgi:hypothetical protein
VPEVRFLDGASNLLDGLSMHPVKLAWESYHSPSAWASKGGVTKIITRISKVSSSKRHKITLSPSSKSV